MTVWKFTIPLDTPRRHYVLIPRGAEVISVGEQAGALAIWARIPEGYTMQKEARAIVTAWTGEPFSGDYLKFIGTVQAASRLVWHVFEEIEP